jgi:DNA-binding MarR family transcriptional regulator
MTDRKDVRTDKRGEAPQGAGTPRRGSTPGARFAYAGLDRLLHERARLSILTSLAAHSEGLAFNDLKMLCALTDGNLSRQLQILAEAGLLEIVKGHRNNRPQTMAKLTAQGRKRFSEYLSVLQEVIADAAARDADASPARGGLSTA